MADGDAHATAVERLEAELAQALSATEKAHVARGKALRMLERSRAARQADAQDAQARQERLRARGAVSLASVVAARERDRITRERALERAEAARKEADAAIKLSSGCRLTGLASLRFT